ncbi:MAG: N-acetyltransferase [Candidatus Omnitrophica bacterium]|nr:N-acetyltransferase [Candidatus Omnitrophota bacterium]
MNNYQCLAKNVKLGKNVKLSKFVNLYGCSIGDNTKIGSFVEVQKNAKIGKNCKISSHTFICEGVTIGDNSFVGHGVVFINDNYPRSVTKDKRVEEEKDWMPRFVKTSVKSGVSIGSNATILGDITIGTGAVIGAGSVVTRNVPPRQIWAGNPARLIRKIKNGNKY